MMSRPLLTCSVLELENYAESNKYSLKELTEIKHELAFRSSYPRQLDLKWRVDRRIAQLQAIRGLLRSIQKNSIDSHSVFWRWFEDKGEIAQIFEGAVIHGYSPLPDEHFIPLLEWFGIKYCGFFRADVETLIIGEEGWEEEDLKRQLDLRTGEGIGVYSQEMVLAFLGCGKDPLQGGNALLRYFSLHHTGLKFLQSIGFPWPSAAAFPGAGSLTDPDWPDVGMLGHMGYSVGRSGESLQRRRKILQEVFERERLPRVKSPEYVADWGDSMSAVRLHKIAEELASFARLRKRRRDSHNSAEAITDWEDDLKWLKDKFYTGRFRFQWPSTWV